jgi:NAD dependent epimerase/dehydratase family enzyme
MIHRMDAAIGRVLHRPSWLPALAFAVRNALGEMADSLLFTSIRMVPRRPLDLGFRFDFGVVERALKELLA